MSAAIVEEVDGRLMVAVPRELQDELHLVKGEVVALKREGDELTMSTHRQYSLEQLIREHRAIADQLEEDRAWLDAPRVGRELI